LPAGAVGPRNEVAYLASDPSLAGAGSGDSAAWGSIFEQIAGPPVLGAIELIDDPEQGRALRIASNPGTAVGTLLARTRLLSVTIGSQELLPAAGVALAESKPLVLALPAGADPATTVVLVWERIVLPVDAERLADVLGLASDDELAKAGLAHSARTITTTTTLERLASGERVGP
jgi:hypothetical protein